MARIGGIKVAVNEGEDYVRAWLAVADRARLVYALTNLSTTREGETLHKDIVSCRGTLYKIVAENGMAKAKKIVQGSVLPESVRAKASVGPDEKEAAFKEWMAAAKASSCDVLSSGPPTIALNGIGTVVHRYTGRRYEVLFSGYDDDEVDLFAVPKA